MKKIIYTPFMKVLMTITLVVSACTFAYMTIFTYDMNSDKYTYKTVDEMHEDIVLEKFASYGSDLIEIQLKNTDENYVLQWRVNSLNDTSEHNFRYSLSLDGKNISSNYDQEIAIFNQNLVYDIVKISYYDEENETVFSEYYLDSGELIWIDDAQIIEKYSSADIMWNSNLIDTSSSLYQKIPTYVTRDTSDLLYDIAMQNSTYTQSFEYSVDDEQSQYTDTSKFDYTIYAQTVGQYSLDAYYLANPDVIDVIAIELAQTSVNYQLSKYYEVILLMTITLCGLCSVGLLFAWGRKNGTEQVQTGTFERIPLDLYLFASAIIATIPFIIYQNSYQIYHFLTISVSEMIMPYICIGVASLVSFLALRTVVIRLKARVMIKNTLVWKFLCFIAKPFEKPCTFVQKQLEEATIVSKVLFWAIVYAVISTILSLIISPFIFNILEKIILIPLLVAFAVMLKKLQISGEILSKGDINHTIDTKYLFGDFKEHAENLNEIKFGLQEAVQEQMKSERLKTELITNVSHDIKTPLTSIINYVDLISKEDTENEKIKEYSAVLSKNSYRLKKLIEDLVSASKASTGNMEVNFEEVDLSMLLTQTIGEYSERFEENQLEIVASSVNEPVIISADGKLMWRVFDNLLGNICKYSQQNTRVYLDVLSTDEKVTINVKNISKYSLNVHSSELLERFVRGDSSRHTEGSGLGLSIAKNLVLLQNGTLDLIIDGDLFKVVIEFDK